MLVRLHLAELLVDEDAGEDTSYAPKESDSISPITSVGRNFDLRDSSALLQNTLERQFASEWLLPILNRHPAVAAAAKKNRSVAIRLIYAAGNSTMVEIARAGATEATIAMDLQSQEKIDGLTVGLTIQHEGQNMNVMPGSDLEAFAALAPIVNGFITTLPDTHYAGDEECTRGLRVYEKEGAPGIVARCYAIDVPKAGYDHAGGHVAGPSSQPLPPAAAAAPTATSTSTNKTAAPTAKKAQQKKNSTSSKDGVQQKKSKSTGKDAEDGTNAKTTKTPTHKKSKEAEANAKNGGDKGDGKKKGAEGKAGKKKAQPSNDDNDDDAGTKKAATTKPSAATKANKAKASADAKAADEMAELVSKWNQLPAKAREAECSFSTDVLLKMGKTMAKEIMMRALIKAGEIPDDIALLGKKASSSDGGVDDSSKAGAKPAEKGGDASAKKKSTSDTEKPKETKISRERKEREGMTVAPDGFKFSKQLQARFDRGDYTAEEKWQMYLEHAEKNRQAVARSVQKKKEAKAAADAAAAASSEDEASAKQPAAPDEEESSSEDEQAAYARRYIASDNDVGDSDSDSDFEKKPAGVKKASGSAKKRTSSNKEAASPSKKSKNAAVESATGSRKRSNTLDGADVEDPNFKCPARIKKKFDSLTSVEEKKQLVADFRKKGREAVARSKAKRAAAAAGKKLVSDDDEEKGEEKTPSDVGAEKSAEKRKSSSGEDGSSKKKKKRKKKKKSSASSKEVHI